MRKKGFLNSEFSVKGTKKQLAKLEPLLKKCGIKSDEEWNITYRKAEPCNYIIVYPEEFKMYEYHSHSGMKDVKNGGRGGYSYEYTRAQLNKIIKRLTDES